MHGPSFWVHVYLRPEKPVDLGHVVESIYPSMLGMVVRSFIRPQSMESRVPGKATAYKFPGSIDGSVYWPDAIDMELLPSEEFLPGPGVTKLADACAAMDYTTNANSINSYINNFYSILTKRFLSTGSGAALSVSFTCWGLTRCSVYDRTFGDIQEDWFLRGRSARQGHFTPILMLFFSHPIENLINRYQISFSSCSHIFSLYDYNDKEPAILIPAKSDERTEAAYYSAELFAKNVRELVRCVVGGAPVQWEVECEHKLDFDGAITEMLKHHLGPMGSRL